MSSHLKTKIIVGALGLAMLPMIVLTWFTYQVFDVRCTQLLMNSMHRRWSLPAAICACCGT